MLDLHTRVALKFSAQKLVASQTLVLTGSSRLDYSQEVFDMAKSTYAKIGLPLSKPSDLLKYQEWHITTDSDGAPLSFATYKTTNYGKKLGLAGHDGSSSGKAVVKALIATQFHKEGFYGEVSHGVEYLAMKAGVPVVPNYLASKILGKPVDLEDDGLHYTRNLKGVGTVTKMLIGKPRGLSSMTQDRAATSELTTPEEHDHRFDLLIHMACLSLDCTF